MRLVEPSVEHWINFDNEQHAIKCAQVCYASEKNIENKTAWLKSKLNAGHTSIFRHQTYYFIIPVIVITDKLKYYFTHNPYIGYYENDEWGFVSINGQTYNEVPWIKHLFKYSSSELGLMGLAKDEGCAKEVEMILRKTFCIITQISTSRELNRVSPNNICEQSTRYCNFNNDNFNGEVNICKPWWFKDEENAIQNHYLRACEISTNVYKELIESGMKPQDARGVLPLDTATKVVYTYRIEEWKHIIDLRYYGKAGIPHPNAKITMSNLVDKLNDELGYNSL